MFIFIQRRWNKLERNFSYKNRHLYNSMNIDFWNFFESNKEKNTSHTKLSIQKFFYNKKKKLVIRFLKWEACYT